jgi:hypothetical protein
VGQAIHRQGLLLLLLLMLLMLLMLQGCQLAAQVLQTVKDGWQTSGDHNR